MFCWYIVPGVTHSGDTINSSYKLTDPTIDGIFNNLNEWSDSTITHLTTSVEVYIYTKNDNDFLYVCLDAIGDTSNGMDGYYLIFDTDHDGAPTPNHDDLFLGEANQGHEHYVDDAGAGYNPQYHCDFSSHSGLEGAIAFGTSPNSAITHQIYEIKIPLDLLTVEAGNTLGFVIYVFDADTMLTTIWPTGVNPNDLSTWGDLILSSGIPEEIILKSLEQTPANPTPMDNVVISANFSSYFPMDNVSLWYSVNDSTWNQIQMNLVTGTLFDGKWIGTIPAQPWNSFVTYSIVAFNNVSKWLKTSSQNYTVLGYQPPNFLNTTQDPPINSITSSDNVAINCSISDSFAGIENVTLYYSVNNSAFIPIPMNLVAGTNYNGIWNGTIPANSSGTVISYYILAFNREGLFSFSPKNAPWETYGYYIDKMDNEPPVFVPIQIPSTPSWNEYVSIQCWVNCSREISGIKNVTIEYIIGNASKVSNLMNYSSSFTIGSSVFSNYSYTFLPMPYNETVKYNITTCDLVGNVLTSGPYVYVVNDTVAPNISIIEPPINPVSSDPLNFKIKIDEGNGSGVQNCTLYTQINVTNIYPHESVHPYPNNCNDNWTYTYPNASFLVVKFQKIETEANYDFLVIYNENDTEVFRFNGSYLWDFISSPLTIIIPGNTCKIQLISDMLVTRWGYKLLEITAVLHQTNTSMILVEGTIVNGNWSISLGNWPQDTHINYSFLVFDNEGNNASTTIINTTISEHINPTITEIRQNIQHPHSTDSVNITVTATDGHYFPYTGAAFINYTIFTFFGGTTSYYKAMVPCSTTDNYYMNSSSWSFIIPPQADRTTIYYHIDIFDLYSNMNSSPEFSYIVDDTPPYINSYQIPMEPTYLDTILIQLNLIDLFFPNYNGSGILNASITYSTQEDYLLESVHSVPNNYQYIWTISKANAEKMRLHLSKIELETNFDILTIYDEAWNPIQQFTGSIVDQWTNWVEGTLIYINLTTDATESSWGFNIDKLEYYSTESFHLVSGSIQNGQWEVELNPLSHGQVMNYYIEAYDLYENYVRDPGAGTYSLTVDDPFAPSINSIQLSTMEPLPYEDISLSINVVDNGSGIENVTLFLSVDGGLNWNSILMNNSALNYFTFTIPGQPGDANVKYYFVIYDKAGNSLRNPVIGSYSLQVTPEQPTFELIPDWLFWLIIGLIAGIFVGSLLLYGRKRGIVTPPTPKKPAPKSPPPAMMEEVPSPPKQPPSPEVSIKTDELRNEIMQYLQRAESAFEKNYLHLAYTNITRAAELALQLDDEELAQKILKQAETIKTKMDSTANTQDQQATSSPPEIELQKPPIPPQPEAPKPSYPPTGEFTKQCPHCGKWIAKYLEKCPYCQTLLKTE